MVDNAITKEVFGLDTRGQYDSRSGYDAAELARKGISRQQQVDLLKGKYETAKGLRDSTNEYKYQMMMNDIANIARGKLDADGRQFRK